MESFAILHGIVETWALVKELLECTCIRYVHIKLAQSLINYLEKEEEPEKQIENEEEKKLKNKPIVGLK